MARVAEQRVVAPAPTPVEVPEDLDDLITRLRTLAKDEHIRTLLEEAGIFVPDEDDETLHLESMNEGTLEQEFQRAQRDIRRAFDDATTDNVRGKLKAAFKASVSFSYDTDKDLLIIETSANVTLPKGRSVARAANFGGHDDQLPFRQQLETRRQPRLGMKT